MKNSKLKNTSIFSFFTGISRILGLLREMLRAYAFGTSFVAVAFDTAFRLPNMLRNLVAEGALSNAFVPIYNDYNDKAEAKEASGAVFMFFLLTLSVLTVIVFFTAPYFMPLLMNDASATHKSTELAIQLIRLLFPYIIFMSLSSIYISIQYSKDIFWGGSFGPALLNLIILLGFGIYIFVLEDLFSLSKIVDPTRRVYVFASVILFAAFSTLLFQSRIVKKLGLSPRYKLNLNHKVFKPLFLIMLPAVFAASTQQIGQLIDIYLVTKLHDKVPGALSALTYSHRLLQLPIGIFGVAVATASLPEFSRLYKENKIINFQKSLISSIRLNFYFLLPAMIVLFVYAKEIIQLLLQRGEFTSHSTMLTAYALKFYALGVIAYSLQKTFIMAFYAQKNSKTPAIITAVVLILNISLAIYFMQFFNHGGLAIGSVIAAYTGVIIYIILLKKKNLFSLSKNDILNITKILLANFLLLGCLYLLHQSFSTVSVFIQIMVMGGCTILSYIIFSYILKIEEVKSIASMLKRIINKVKK